MTTDRTATPAPRASALAERPSPPAGRSSTAPSDTFALLLGAANPAADHQAPARRPEQPERSDRHRTDRSDRADTTDRRRADRDDRADRTDHASTDQGQGGGKPDTAADATGTAPAAPADASAQTTHGTATALLTAQLSSPLAAAPAPPAAPAPADGKPAPVKMLPGPIAAKPLPGQPLPGQPPAGAPAAGEAAPGKAPDPAAPAAPATLDAAVRLPLAVAGKPLPKGTVPLPGKPAADAKPAPAVAPGQAKPADAVAPAPAPSPAAPAPQAAPAAAANVADATAKPADAPPAPQPATPPLAGTAFAAPAAAPANAPGAVPQRLVPMGRVVENTAALLHLAADRGVTHARLNLKPAELGGIEVRLRATPDGVAAQLVADSPDAARLLSQAGDDLRRQLADQNVNLLSLDVSTSGEQQQSAAQFAADAGAGDGYRSGSARRASHRATALDGGDAVAPAAAESTLLLPTGVLVDVLA